MINNIKHVLWDIFHLVYILSTVEAYPVNISRKIFDCLGISYIIYPKRNVYGDVCIGWMVLYNYVLHDMPGIYAHYGIDAKFH